MASDLFPKIKRLFANAKKAAETLNGEIEKEANPSDSLFDLPGSENSSLARSLVGGVGTLGDYYISSDLIGGCCPRVVGEEQDIVWNAAAEAVDSERLHLIWSAKGDKIWYLAVRSSEMGSHPNTWCPFASLLPGLKDSADPPTIYTFFSDESATMMTVLEDGLQIHRGTSSVIRAKAERASREMGGAPIIELIPDRIEKLTPVAWYSLSLFEDRARRVLATLSVFAAVVFAALCLLVWFAASMSALGIHADLKEIRQRSETKSLQLLQSVQTLRASPMREQLARFSDVNDGLLGLNGYLEIYRITGNKAEWRAVLPANVTADRIRELGGQTLDTNEQGVVIGSSRDALTIEKEKRR